MARIHQKSAPLGDSVEPSEITTVLTSLTPAASITIAADEYSVDLVPDQATEIDLATSGVQDGQTKLLRVRQGGTGYAISFAAGVTEIGGGAAQLISDAANTVTYVFFRYNSNRPGWECLSVMAEAGS